MVEFEQLDVRTDSDVAQGVLHPVDASTKALDDDKIDARLAKKNIQYMEKAGFKMGAAGLLAAFLLVPCARAESTCDAVAVRSQDEGYSYDWVKLILMVGFISGIAATLIALWIGKKIMVVIVGKKEERSVNTQSPVTYARHREQPRFAPLSEHAWGAW